MKLGILTLPLNTNYGGLLQAYALQTALKRMGHEVITVDLRLRVYNLSLLMNVGSFIKRAVLSWIFRRENIMDPFISHITLEDREVIAQHTSKFIKEYIATTEWIDSIANINKLDKYNFDGYVVGSDQVWRPQYSPDILTYFLDFVKGKPNIKRVAYAASFGVTEWEITPELIEQCALLSKKFDLISVREDSARMLCKNHLGVDAVHVLDPTMLLEKEDYISLIEKDRKSTSNGSLFTYILDKSNEKHNIINSVGNRLGLRPFSSLPKYTFREIGRKGLDDCIFPPVTDWLRGFMDAEYVVTDSFHGCVFSIIFNKPFIAIGNADRGMVRFTSLLKYFELESRLIDSSNEITCGLIDKKIDFIRVNEILQQGKQKSCALLSDALSRE